MTPYIMDYEDYDPEWPIHFRDSARAIVLNEDNKLLMIYSGDHRYYLFPGGGIKFRETFEKALSREVMEETGYYVIPKSPKSYVSVTCRYKDGRSKYDRIFESRAKYFKARVGTYPTTTELTRSEKKKRIRAMWVDPLYAYEVNIGIIDSGVVKDEELKFLKRETHVLRMILDDLQYENGIE